MSTRKPDIIYRLLPVRWRPDLPFSQEDAHRTLPWVIAVMVAISGLIAAFGLSFGDFVMDYHSTQARRVQIQIPYADGEENVQARAITKRLQSISAVTNIRQLPADEVRDSLKSWMNDDILLDVLPLPAVIEAEFSDGTSLDGAWLSHELKDAYPTVVVDDFKEWMQDFSRLSERLRQLSYGMALLMLTCAAIVVLLITRASVQLHFPIIQLLHRMGSPDIYIARQFQRNAALLTLKGGYVGALSAGALFVMTVEALRHLQIPLLPQLEFTPLHVVMLVVLPALMATAVAAVTFFSVNRILVRIY